MRRRIARPAQSAVAIAALGVIVAFTGRAIFVRHSEPASAAGSSINAAQSATMKPQLTPPPVSNRATASPSATFSGDESDASTLLEDSTTGDLIDDREPPAK